MRTATVGADDDTADQWNRSFERAYCAPGFSVRDPERAGWLFHLARTTPSNRDIVMGAMEQTPVESYWGRFDCPALLLYGADDLVGTAENAEDLHRQASSLEVGLHRTSWPFCHLGASRAFRRGSVQLDRGSWAVTIAHGSKRSLDERGPAPSVDRRRH